MILHVVLLSLLPSSSQGWHVDISQHRKLHDSIPSGSLQHGTGEGGGGRGREEREGGRREGGGGEERG